MSDRTSWDDLGGDDQPPEPPKRRPPAPTSSDDFWADDEEPQLQRRRPADDAAGSRGDGSATPKKAARTTRAVRTTPGTKKAGAKKAGAKKAGAPASKARTVAGTSAAKRSATKEPGATEPEAPESGGREPEAPESGATEEAAPESAVDASTDTSPTAKRTVRTTRTGATKAAAKQAAAPAAGTSTSGTQKAGVKKTGVKKTGAKKTVVKKTGAEKAVAEKAGAEKTAAEKAGAEKAAAETTGAEKARTRTTGATPETTEGATPKKAAASATAASTTGGRRRRRRRRRLEDDRGAVSTGGDDDVPATPDTEQPVTGQPVTDRPVDDQPVDAPMTPARPPREITYADFIGGTDEGGQQLRERAAVPARERLREVGAVLRMSEAEAAALGELPDDPDEDQTMIINMGPQHPSTHGVLRLMLELQGEKVLRCKPIIGYLHTGMEKTGEQLTYIQGGTNVTRMDYLSPFANELVFSMATEKLLGIDEDIPERAVWIRMLMAELNRMSSHLLFMATNGMDLGAVSMMIYGWREREEVLRFFQEVTGLRMNHNYIRPGGVAADLPAGWRDGVLRLLDLIPPRLDEYDLLMTGQPIWRERLQGVGVITPDEAVALGVTGPILRATGVEWDLRRTMPYMHYDELDFDVIVGTYGDAFDRYAIRLAEIRESMRIVAQILDRMPPGDYRIQDKKVTPPPRARIDESMEALIHHFKLFTEGFKVPEGEVYVGIESPRGEVGCYIASDGGPNPYRMHVRAPSFANIQCLPHMMRGGLVADAVAIISSVDPVLGDVDR